MGLRGICGVMPGTRSIRALRPRAASSRC
jgi:hypothetical protein